jgi:hypothetical protein
MKEIFAPVQPRSGLGDHPLSTINHQPTASPVTPAAPQPGEPSTISPQPSTRKASTSEPAASAPASLSPLPSVESSINHQPPAINPCPKETQKAFSAFLAYLDLGPNRTFLDCAQSTAIALTTVKFWAGRYQWKKRVQAYNTQVIQTRLAAEASLQSAAAIDWVKRCQELREVEWTAARELLAAASAHMHNLRDKDPDKVSFADIARALEVASKLGRLAAGLVTEKTEISGQLHNTLSVDFIKALDQVYGAKPSPLTPPPTTIVDITPLPQ